VAWRLSGFDLHARGFAAWLTFYVHRGFHFPPANRLAGGLDGVARSIVAVRAFDLPVLLLLAGLGSVVLAAWRSEARRLAPLAAPLALAALAAGALATWWEPGSHKFWIPALVCAWLAAGLRLAAAGHPRSVGVAAAAAALAMWNLATAILPRHDASANPFPAVARQIASVTVAADLIIVGTDALSPSLAYYGERPRATNLFALGLRAVNAGAEKGPAGVRALVAAARAHGERVFISSDSPLIQDHHRALIGDLPPTVSELLPGAERVPRLHYRLHGATRTLYEIR
jgi:hypothetical protein